jgi:hypothetical protein
MPFTTSRPTGRQDVLVIEALPIEKREPQWARFQNGEGKGRG